MALVTGWHRTSRAHNKPLVAGTRRERCWRSRPWPPPSSTRVECSTSRPWGIDGPLGRGQHHRRPGGVGQGAARTAFRDLPPQHVQMNPVAARYRALIGTAPRAARPGRTQLDDNDAINALGVRLDAYAKLDCRSCCWRRQEPEASRRTLDALERRCPQHPPTAHGTARSQRDITPRPAAFAQAIARQIDEELRPLTPAAGDSAAGETVVREPAARPRAAVRRRPTS